jgi:hypothetical protein
VHGTFSRLEIVELHIVRLILARGTIRSQ